MSIQPRQYSVQELEQLLNRERASFIKALDEGAAITELQSIKERIKEIYKMLELAIRPGDSEEKPGT